MPAAFEGWVVEDPEGTRHKLVQVSFQRTGRVAPQLHPLSLWGMVRNCGMSRAELSAGLPPHFQRELHAILDALESQFCRVQRALAHMAAQAQAHGHTHARRTNAHKYTHMTLHAKGLRMTRLSGAFFRFQTRQAESASRMRLHQGLKGGSIISTLPLLFECCAHPYHRKESLDRG